MKKGFTLIEILIVVGVMMMIMVSIGGIMSGVFNSQSKNTASDKITQNGGWILSELKKNVLNANSNDLNDGLYFSCPPVGGAGTSIVITSVKDDEKTTISCFNNGSSGNDDYKIASISGKAIGTTIFLFQSNQDLKLVGCNNFVSCSTLPEGKLSNVKFNFALKAGIEGLSSGTTKTFSIDVTLRN